MYRTFGRNDSSLRPAVQVIYTQYRPHQYHCIIYSCKYIYINAHTIYIEITYHTYLVLCIVVPIGLEIPLVHRLVLVPPILAGLLFSFLLSLVEPYVLTQWSTMSSFLILIGLLVVTLPPSGMWPLKPVVHLSLVKFTFFLQYQRNLPVGD